MLFLSFFEPTKCLTDFNTIAYIMPNIDKQLNIFSQLGQNMLINCVYGKKAVFLHTQGNIFVLNKIGYAYHTIYIRGIIEYFSCKISLLRPLNMLSLIVIHLSYLDGLKRI